MSFLSKIQAAYSPEFTFEPQYLLGVSSNEVNVKLKGKMVGYLEAKDVPAFEKGNVVLLTPVKDWKTSFSVQLIDYLQLKKYAVKAADNHTEIAKEIIYIERIENNLDSKFSNINDEILRICKQRRIQLLHKVDEASKALREEDKTPKTQKNRPSYLQLVKSKLDSNVSKDELEYLDKIQQLLQEGIPLHPLMDDGIYKVSKEQIRSFPIFKSLNTLIDSLRRKAQLKLVHS